jgi:hypothetical protein
MTLQPHVPSEERTQPGFPPTPAEQGMVMPHRIPQYLRSARTRRVSPEDASAILLLNLIREVHVCLSEAKGSEEADAAIDRAIERSMERIEGVPLLKAV